MPDVKDLNFTATLHNAIDNAIHIRFATVKKLAKVFVLRRHRAPPGIVLQSEYCPLEPVEPSKSDKIALGARCNLNRVSHAWP